MASMPIAPAILLVATLQAQAPPQPAPAPPPSPMSPFNLIPWPVTGPPAPKRPAPKATTHAIRLAKQAPPPKTATPLAVAAAPVPDPDPKVPAPKVTVPVLPPVVPPPPSPVAAAPAPPPVDPHAPPPKRFNIKVYDEGPATFLPQLAKQAGVRLVCVGDMFAPIDLTFHNRSFDEVLAILATTSGIQSQKLPDGSYKVGYPSDLLLESADAKDTTEVDYLYRPHHLDAESLAAALTAAFPDLKVSAGPLDLSPTLDGGGGAPSAAMPGMPAMPAMGTGMAGSNAGGTLSSSDPGTLRALAATATPFKRHEVTLIGPVNRVRRAMVLARRMDRGRRQVKINVNMSEMTSSDASNLGINWDFTGTSVNLAELPNPAIGNVVAATATSPAIGGNSGMHFGTFAHTPASVNLSLQAGIQKGTIKTLADPSLLVLDGERCFLLLGNRILYPKQTGITALGNPSYDVAQLATGVYLQMAVQIGVDDDVIISVYPQNSFVSSYQTYNDNQYPVVTTREAQTTVQLRSGQMMAIGGMHQNQESNSSSKVPFLGSIPLLGALFGTKNSSRSKDELVIIIQPELLPAESGKVAIIDEVK